MPKEQFINHPFRKKTLNMIHLCNQIIDDLRAQGYTLTLRQLFYQLVSRDVIPNKQAEYKKLGETLNHARLSGLVDWSAIEDRTRNLRSLPDWQNPASILNSVAYQYRIDKWAKKFQQHRVEVWVEKDALVGVLEKACNPLYVPFFSCRGYGSQSEYYVAAKRFQGYMLNGQTPVIIHLGDHDPSGVHMSVDIIDRIQLLSRRDIEVRRIALNMDQIEEYSPPPNPAKVTDSRFEGYQKQYGDESWELDAIDPRVLDALITETILEFRDDDGWARAVKQEDGERSQLAKLSTNWDATQKFLKKIKKTKK